MSLSFHPIGLHFLAWCGLVPLLFAVQDVKPSTAFKTGILFGFLFSLFSLFWLVFLQIETNIKILLLFGLILLFLYYGLYYGTGLLITSKISIWILPFVLSGLEFVRGLGEIGFPWLSLGYSQARYPLVIQQASLYGVYGISLWLIFVNVSLFKLLKIRNAKYATLFLIIFCLPLLYGALRIKAPNNEFISIGIVQPSIDPNLKFTRAMREETLRRLINLSQKCTETGINDEGNAYDLIIWPETAIPIFLKSPSGSQTRVLDLSNRIKTCILTGTPIYDNRDREVYNGAVLIEPDKGITQEYRKMHLVPFGEHIPFDQYCSFLRKIDVGGGHYAPGKEYTVFETEKMKFSCLICFESIFPEISRESVINGAEFLINITNDGWFGKISGPQQHNDMAILRSVENGVPLTRCSNTGISMIVDKYGNILKETKLFKEDFITSPVSTEHTTTLYQIFGDLLPIVSLIFTVLALIFKSTVHR